MKFGAVFLKSESNLKAGKVLVSDVLRQVFSIIFPLTMDYCEVSML